MTQLIHSATRPGFVPAAQVSRGELVALASRALAALEEFMAALTPADPTPIRENHDAEPAQPLRKIEPQKIEQRQIATRKNYTSTDKVARAGNPPCPECGDETVRRTRRSNGSIFFGCINYPNCKATTDAQHFSTQRGAMTQRSPDTTRRTP